MQFKSVAVIALLRRLLGLKARVLPAPHPSAMRAAERAWQTLTRGPEAAPRRRPA